MAETEQGIGGYTKLRRELRRRTVEPFFQPPFVFYVLTGVVLFGGLGIWVELAKLLLANGTAPVGVGTESVLPVHSKLEPLVTAVITFFSTLAGASTIQLNYSSYEGTNKAIGSFALLLMCCFAALALLLALLGSSQPRIVLLLGAICSLAAVWVWWITNGDEPTFREITPKDAEAAVGGNPERELPGTLEGFEA
ncbi:hypothetical protein JQ597_25250 [Bradyrhizobium sp. AUGA SZCCT0177]|uniref:hypothetical protein n=1 Tax=Bradyrhizobium sp. AUGA SZCCT0177 TaxID=2807665 RepID=UPI001BAE09D1|nr:hypothetical protein [Bradyrhizobium sp. AUGA SZCCT0177]MBR1285361.1 hypothetical protein [Bradyrhizobium sp. AUGA SZCCT0177]